MKHYMVVPYNEVTGMWITHALEQCYTALDAIRFAFSYASTHYECTCVVFEYTCGFGGIFNCIGITDMGHNDFRVDYFAAR